MANFYNIKGETLNFDDYSTDVPVTCHLDMLINLFKNSNESIFLTDGNGEIIYANDKFLELYGYNEEEILNRTPSIFAVTGNSEIIYDEVSRSNFSGKWNGKLLSKKSNGSAILIELIAERLFNKDENTYATVWITRDITFLKNKNPVIKNVMNKNN